MITDYFKSLLMKTETYKITFIELFVIANFDAVTLQKFDISL